MSLSLLHESSLEAEFAFHVRRQNGFLSRLCCIVQAQDEVHQEKGPETLKWELVEARKYPFW